MKNYYHNRLPIALLVLAILCINLAGCKHDNDVHQQVVNYITQAEQQLDKEDLDSSMAILRQAYDFAKEKGYVWGMAEANLNISRCFVMTGQADSAITYLDKGMKAYPEMPDSMLTQYYAEYAVDYGLMGEMAKAKETSLKTIPLMLKYGTDEDKATIYANTGIYYRHLGMNDSAIYYYQQGLDIALKNDDYESQALLANNVAVLYADMQRFKECYDYCQKAADAARKAGNKEMEVRSLMTRGAALVTELKYEDAADCLLDAYNQVKDGTNPIIKLGILSPLIKAVYHSKRPEVNRQYQQFMQQGDQLYAQQAPNSINAANWLNSKMTLLVEQQRYQEALNTITKIEEIQPQMQVLPVDKLYTQKARCLYRLGRHKEAYELQLEASLAADSLKNEEVTNKLSQLTSSYEMTQKELEVARLSQQHSRNQTRIAILAALLIALLAALGALALWTRQRRQQATMRETRRWVEGIEQERARFARELHDGACNDLLAIGMQLHGDKADTAQIGQQISTLRATLRNLSHELMPPQFKDGVRLDQALEYYLSHIDSPKVDFHAEGDGWESIPADTAYQVYRITQEAIGNIITHQPGAHVQVNLSPTRLDIISTGTMQQGDGSGIGLQSMKDRASSIGAILDTDVHDDTFALALKLRATD